MSVSAVSKEELRDLYRELILDHARNPRHFGKLEGMTHNADGINALCGDKLHLYLRLDGDRIQEVAFEGTGCAISVASASLLTEVISGMTVAEAEEFFEAITAQLTGEAADNDVDLGKLAALEGVKEFPSRVKCATLAWHAMHAALNNDSLASTES